MFNSIAKKLIKSRMIGVPEEEQEKFFTLVEKNPGLFQNIIEEIKTEINNGKDQAQAVFDVINKHKEDLKTLESSK